MGARWLIGLVLTVLAFAAAHAEDGIAVAAGPVKLVANMTAPQGKGPFPTVVIVTGAGPSTRNAAGTLTAALNAAGIAVVRYDKRGCGDSTGDLAAASVPELIDDARAIVKYVKTRADVDIRRIALIGLSQGAVISPAVAVKDGGIAALVLLGPPAMRLDQLSLLQWEIVAREHGGDDAFVAKGRAQFARLTEVVTSARSDEDMRARSKPLLDSAVAQGLIPQAQVEPILAGVSTQAQRDAFTYDPAAVLRQVKVPVLALTGSLDRQVPADPNLPILRQALAADSDVTAEVMPGLNHIFQMAKTGSAEEWGQLNQPAYGNPQMLQRVTDWLTKRLR